MNFLFSYGPCANSLSFLTISVSLKFHGRKNFEGPSASMSLLMRRMYSFMLGEAVRNFHRFIVASSGRCGNFLMISFRSSSVRYNTAGSHPCTGCLLAPANCMSLSRNGAGDVGGVAEDSSAGEEGREDSNIGSP